MFSQRWFSLRVSVLIVTAIGLSHGLARAQAGESDLRVYGFLQASFYQEYYADSTEANSNTFTVQQLNILLQKNLGRRWSAFVDILLTNNYASYRNYGTLDLQQAWVRYRHSYHLNIKAGLLIPQFNYLNEIKNKMPVLPYIIRPIVYETSFQEEIPLDEYVPQQAYVQVYGYAPADEFKIEYAGYAGNSPNVNTDPDYGPTGVDTTNSLLVGGRVGVRHPNFTVGFSATHDKVDQLDGVMPDSLSPAFDFANTNRVRVGADVEAEYRGFRFESEYISVNYDDGRDDVKNDKRFYYGTLGYQATEKLFVYGSYWQLEQYYTGRDSTVTLTPELVLRIPNGGVAYQMSDRITFKGAAAYVKWKFDLPGVSNRNWWFLTTAVSVMF